MKIVISTVLLLLSSLVWSGSTNYSIISESNYAHYTKTYNVRLQEKLSQFELRKIAQVLKSRDKNNYNKTFIFFLLPEMQVNSGAWATAHYDPTLKVEVLGLTKTEEEEAKSNHAGVDGDVIGKWIDNRPYSKSFVTIYEKDGKTFLETKYSDGSGLVSEMATKKIDGGTRLDEKEGNAHGEYYLLESNGTLHSAGSNGIFLTYQKLTK